MIATKTGHVTSREDVAPERLGRPDAVFSLLSDILHEISESRRIFEAVLHELQTLNGNRRRSISHREHLILDRLIPAIRGEYGGDTWTARELLNTPWAHSLVQMTPSELGSLLARSIGEDINGLTVSRVGRDHNRVLWRLQQKTTPD